MADRLDLGVGIVAHGGLDLLWSDISDLIDVVEVEPQTLCDEVPGGWSPDPAAMAWLQSVDRPILAHGVGFPVAGQVEPDPRGTSLFARCCTELGAAHASEHLSFNRSTSTDVFTHAGFLLPPRQTWSTVEATVEHIAGYQARLDVPFLVECGVSYLAPADVELDDSTFLSEIVERADCGLLLDLHNMLANERNGRDPVEQILRGLPLDRVLEVHVAGGEPFGGYWLDAHSGGCDQALMSLLATTLPLLPNVRAVVFEAMSMSLMSMGAEGVRRELEALHRSVDAAARRPTRLPSRRSQGRIGTRRSGLSEAEWQRRVIAYTTRRCPDPPSTDPGFSILRELTDQARLSRVAAGAGDTVTSLRTRLGPAALQAVAGQYLTECDAQVWTSAEAESFVAWLDTSGRR